MACTMRLTKPMRASSHVHISSSMPIHSYQVLIFNTRNSRKEFNKQSVLLGQQNLIPVPKSSQPNDSVVPSEDDENGVSLGTMKLPPNTDLQHFDSLLFQWANSLCQGANLPLPMPLKVQFLKMKRIDLVKDEIKSDYLPGDSRNKRTYQFSHVEDKVILK
ncbi:uncharacterized protein LOC123211864 isoform X3 [Mangifera indica]|uniref:uncharacterized protein LOC123211864 isoform X3 n=1 Tax=Mangifera indica TaxID=29780 RepID=UPI001CFBD6C7|nr:uncharacterized protein LOC123211864 isoform X3 [Mangifera indica]